MTEDNISFCPPLRVGVGGGRWSIPSPSHNIPTQQYFHWSHVLSRWYPSDWSWVPVGPWPGQDGVHPWPGLDGVHPSLQRQNSRASTCYTAGGMPLAFRQDDCLVFAGVYISFDNEKCCIIGSNNNHKTRKSSCVNARGIPPAA